MKNLKTQYGPWAVVTGASSGLGKEIALRLAESGLNLILHGRNEAALQTVAAAATANQVDTAIVAADLSDQAGVRRTLKFAEQYDVGLFVGAAGFGTSGEFRESDLAAEQNMLDVNCKAIAEMTHVFARRFAARGKGGIMLFGSLVGYQGTPFAANYAATKAYVQTLAEGLHYELKSSGVDVLCVSPGPVKTGFGARAKMNMDSAADPAALSGEIVRALGRKMTVKPGFMSKFLLLSLDLLPRWGRVRVMAKVMGGMTGRGKNGTKKTVPHAA